MKAIILLSLVGGCLMADSLNLQVAATVTESPQSLFIYTYTLENEASSTENIFAFSVAYGGSSLISISSPDNWTYVSDMGYLSWVSEGSESDLAPGSQDVFGLTSPLAPGVQQYAAFGSDETFGLPTGDEISGSTTGPVGTTPEPATLWMLLIAAVLPAFIRAAGCRLRSLF